MHRGRLAIYKYYNDKVYLIKKNLITGIESYRYLIRNTENEIKVFRLKFYIEKFIPCTFEQIEKQIK